MGGNCSFCLSESAFQRSVFTQAASGERTAPLGRLNAVDESKHFQRKTVADKEGDDLAFLKSKGMIVTEKPDLEAFRKATVPVYEAMANVVPPALVKKIQESK